LLALHQSHSHHVSRAHSQEEAAARWWRQAAMNRPVANGPM